MTLHELIAMLDRRTDIDFRMRVKAGEVRVALYEWPSNERLKDSRGLTLGLALAGLTEPAPR
jgi:hypothetical protein